MRNLTPVCFGVLLAVAGCQLHKIEKPATEPQPVAPVAAADPVATHQFQLQGGQDVIGEIQVTHASQEDTLSDIARRFNLGYEELVRANPSVDPWVPGEGREIILPTQFVIPPGPHEGLVVNLAALRVFYFPKHKPNEPQTVITHPIGIGKVGWTTPEGSTKVVSKRKDPVWVPPASVRKEHAEHGDPLPSVVPAGVDNPLGAYAMNLGWSGYLIHGTNKPYGVGMRSSHGCLRFYPEDIALLFDEIAVGTKVRVVNQRVVSGWREGQLYVQVMPPSEEELEQQQKTKARTKPKPLLTDAAKAKMQADAKTHGVTMNTELVNTLAEQASGITMPVTRGITQADYLASARRVDNRVPPGATWDGNKQLLVTAEEFEAMKNGVIIPRKEAEPTNKTSAPTKQIPTPPAGTQKISAVLTAH